MTDTITPDLVEVDGEVMAWESRTNRVVTVYVPLLREVAPGHLVSEFDPA